MNEPKSQSTGGAADAGALQARLDRIRFGVTAQQTRLARGSFVTAIVGVVLCGLMAVYFGVFYKWVTDLMTPKKLADIAEDLILNRLPDERKKLEPEIEKNAPDWARDLSQTFQASMPEYRVQLEDIIMGQVEEGLKKLQGLSAERFRGFVVQNRVDLADGFNSLQDPTKSKGFIADLNQAVEKHMASDMQEQAETLLRKLVNLNRKVQRLSKGEGLLNEEAIMREILMTAKRLQNDSAAEKKTKSTTTTSGSETTEEPTPKPEGDKEKPEKEPEPEKKSGDN